MLASCLFDADVDDDADDDADDVVAMGVNECRDVVFKAGPPPDPDTLPQATEESARQALARAMYSVLSRAAVREIAVVTPASAEEELNAFSPASAYAVTTCSDEAETWCVAAVVMRVFLREEGRCSR